MTDPGVDRAKQAIRERVWAALDDAGAAVQPTTAGRIPDFRGKQEAARLLARLPQWRAATVVKANPDKAQHPVRAVALAGGKLLYMAVPRLAAAQPFYQLDPAVLAEPAERAATKEGAAASGVPVSVEDMRPVDLIACGTVAVSASGARIGKGGGYSDIEVALPAGAGLIGPGTMIVTTVHDLQVLDEDIPETGHDFRVDIIVTPTRVIRCGPPRRPAGLYWDHLSPAQIDAIPVLRARTASQRRPHEPGSFRE